MTEPPKPIDFGEFDYIGLVVKLVELMVESSTPIIVVVYATKNRT